MATRYELTAREKELLISARTQLLALVAPINEKGEMNFVAHATGFAREVEKIVADIEKLLGY